MSRMLLFFLVKFILLKNNSKAQVNLQVHLAIKASCKPTLVDELNNVPNDH